jgi:anti-sigma-K factor RskA
MTQDAGHEDAIPEDEILAAELAFGLLDDPERIAALARLDTDPAFARLHARWDAHAARLTEGFETSPPPDLWRRIAGHLPANDNRNVGTRWWQGATAVLTVAALVLATVAVRRPAVVPTVAATTNITSVALLTGAHGSALAIAYDPNTRRLIATPGSLRPDRGAAELWVIPAGGKPLSLGVIPARNTSTHSPAPGSAAAMIPGATLAISDEPPGGSPTGQPTGPVILTGKLIKS